MSDEPVTVPRIKAWLVSRSGPLAGTRYLIPDGITRIGRSADNEIAIQGPQAGIVSVSHAEISKDNVQCRIRDLGSTNGTFLNGERITEAELSAEAVIRLGNDGPEFAFLLEEAGASELDRTLVIPEGILLPQTPPAPAPAQQHEALLSDAVTRARHARIHGLGDQTMTLMRDVLHRALRQSRRRSRVAILVLAVALVATASYGFWKISGLKREKAAIDRQIQEIELRLQKLDAAPEQTDELISQLAAYQQEAATLERNLFYRVGVRQSEDFVTREIRTIMGELGSEVYSIPPDFTERVNHHIHEYLGPNRPHMERALNEAKGKVDTMRRMLEEEKLPPDLAYVPLVESTLATRQTSPAGAAGPWQFTAGTARGYGLRVDGEVDERHNLVKSTRAACRYLRELILDFGAGSSVMLALAAYNLGPPRVRQAIMKVKDPIKQRNFWYLYRARALPAETREYVPKVFAVMIVGRNPQRFGF
jgi:pSer/pThr/pTyr-binding forkhead associated (FHA) protein